MYGCAQLLLLRWFQVWPRLGCRGDEDRGHWHATRGHSCEAHQSLKHREVCTPPCINCVTQVTPHSTVIRTVRPVARG